MADNYFYYQNRLYLLDQIDLYMEKPPCCKLIRCRVKMGLTTNLCCQYDSEIHFLFMVAQYGDLLDEANKLLIGSERFRRLREQWRKIRIPVVSILWCLTNMDKKAKQSKIFFIILTI